MRVSALDDSIAQIHEQNTAFIEQNTQYKRSNIYVEGYNIQWCYNYLREIGFDSEYAAYLSLLWITLKEHPDNRNTISKEQINNINQLTERWSELNANGVERTYIPEMEKELNAQNAAIR